MENIKTYFGNYKIIPFDSTESLERKWGTNDTFTQSMWDNATAYGIINGPRNNNLITIDVDTKHDPSGTLSDRYLQGLKYTFPDLYDSLYIESTRSGGLHVMFHLDPDEECPKKSVPAKSLSDKGTKVGLIEVLGDGQQTFIYPTPTYKILQGALDEIPTIDIELYDELMEFNSSFNLIPDAIVEHKPSSTQPAGTRSGDIYNEQVDPREVVNVMTQYGWELVREVDNQFFLRRPDKDAGVSATFNYANRKLLVVYSTSTQFVAHHDDGSYIGYKPFQILAKLRYDGDFKRCAKELDRAGYRADDTALWNDLRNAHQQGGDVAMRQAIPVDHIAQMTENQITDFVTQIREEFGASSINKRYLTQLREESIEEGEFQNASDQNCNRAMGMEFIDNFGLNELQGGRAYITKPIPDIAPIVGKDGIPVTDRHERNIWYYLLTKYGQSFSREAISTIIDVLAQDNPYHPVQRKLNSLKWDNKPRLETWLIDHCQAKDVEEVRKIGVYFMVGAVARAMKAGCKMDNALILKSPRQGLGKSQLVEVLSYGYSTDDVGSIGSKDCSEKLQGSWIVELPELDNLRGATKEKVKYWLSTRHDDEVQKYEKRVTSRPRQCVFIGTTNEDSLFAEEEFRRFWPVEVGAIDLKAIKEVRDQLWAEAVHLYKNGQKWWSVDINEFSAYSEDSREMHPHEEDIRQFCKNHLELTSRELHFAIYGKTSRAKETYSPSAMREYTPILRKLGYKKVRGKWIRDPE